MTTNKIEIKDVINNYMTTGKMVCPTCPKKYQRRVTDWINHIYSCKGVTE